MPKKHGREYAETHQRLETLARDGFLLLSSHDPEILPTNDRSFTEQYERLIKKRFLESN